MGSLCQQDAAAGTRASASERGLKAERGERAVHDAGRTSVGRRALRGRRGAGPEWSGGARGPRWRAEESGRPRG